ncbi:MAG: efflux RND transporter periplasmic adaptor subunit [Methylococcaceae bacterium]
MNLSQVSCCVLITLFSIATAIADNNDNSTQENQLIDNLNVIILDTKTQQLSGIQTTQLKPVNYKSEFIAYGKAIGIQPLLALRNRYLLALTERNLAATRLKQAEQNMSRQQELYRNGVTSKRLLQDQQMQWQNDKAMLDNASFQDKSIIEEALLNWGKVITEWSLSTDSGKLQPFLSGQQTLLQITLPANKQLSEYSETVFIEASGDRSNAHPAKFISKAPLTIAIEQGQSYFFQTNANNLGTGMKVTAWIPDQNQDQVGVIIPKSSLIWLMEQASIYLKVDEEKFIRRTISDYSVTANGYFIREEIKPGEQIVTTGSQLLLSEELRNQIPQEDDND